MVFESHVIDHEKQSQLEKQKRQQNKKSRLPSSTADKLGKRIEFALELSNTFAPHIILETCIQLLQYIKQLPMHKNELKDDVKRKSFAADSTESSLFNVTAHSDKQLRHYKYTILQFLSNISSCNQFLRKIAVLSEEDLLNLKPYYQNFIIRTLGYVPVVSNAIEHGQEDQQIKTLKIMLHHVHTILDNAISLLSPDMFLVVIYGLMQHKVLSIRKKVIELLINKLQQKDGFFEDTDEQHFANLLEPLAGIVAGILQKHDATSGDSSPSSNHSHELVYLQQTALIALKLLSKTFALKYIAEFKDLLSTLTTILRQSQQISKIILATVILTMIEISSNLKAHSLAYLSKYMPQLVEVLQDQVKSVQNGQTPDNVCTAIIAGKLYFSAH